MAVLDGITILRHELSLDAFMRQRRGPSNNMGWFSLVLGFSPCGLMEFRAIVSHEDCKYVPHNPSELLPVKTVPAGANVAVAGSQQRLVSSLREG